MLSKNIVKTVGYTLVLAAAPAAGATPDEDRVDDIVVTASRLNVTSEQTTKSVETIPRSLIEGSQPANMTELLRQLAGVNVIQQGARGGVTSLILRGGEPNFTVVMIDGIRVNDSTNTRGGSYDFSYLDISNVERVELVRGPMSAIYGSDSLSGVVNIISRGGAAGSSAKVEIGGHGLVSGSIGFGTTSDRWDTTVQVHRYEEDGAVEGGSYEDWGVDGSLAFRLNGDGEMGLSLRYQDADSTTYPEDSGGPELAVIRETDDRSVQEILLRAFVERQMASQWQLSASVGRYERSEIFDSPGIAPGVFDGVPPNMSDTEYTRDNVLANVSTQFGNNFNFVAGAEWQSEEGISVGFLDFGFPLPTDFKLNRDTSSLFAEAQYDAGLVTLQASLRWDDPDQMAGQTSTQIGAIFHLAGGGGDIRVNAGEGFKAPSFFALAHPLVGNPDLEPETARSVDVGYRFTTSAVATFDVSIFHNNYKNLIDFDPDTFMGVNRSSVITKGVEFTGDFPITGDLSIRAHVTYSETDIEDSDTPLRGRPEWRGGVSADWQINDQWRVVASLLALDKFYEVSIPTGGIFLDGYQRFDLSVTYAIRESVTLGLAIDNAFDASYMEAVGFPAPGLRSRLSAQVRF